MRKLIKQIACSNPVATVHMLLKFVDYSDKTVSEIAQAIIETLESHSISLPDGREEGYDNGANMSGTYNGTHAIIKEQFSTAIFIYCSCHTLNLRSNDAAECIQEAITYIVTIQSIYFLFGCSPKRWEYWLSVLVVRFMAYMLRDGQIGLRLLDEM